MLGARTSFSTEKQSSQGVSDGERPARQLIFHSVQSLETTIVYVNKRALGQERAQKTTNRDAVV